MKFNRHKLHTVHKKYRLTEYGEHLPKHVGEFICTVQVTCNILCTVCAFVGIHM